MTDLPPNVYRVRQRDFDAIPGSPWVYWIPDGLRALFETLPKLGDVAQPRQGLATADNTRFLRYWWEVGPARIGFGCQNREEAQKTGKRWFPYMKGGEYRKWYGNQEWAVNWRHDGLEIQNFYGDNGRLASRPQNTDFYFLEALTWTLLSTKGLGVRWRQFGGVFDVNGMSCFPPPWLTWIALSILNSSLGNYLLQLMNPTLAFQVGDIARLPLKHNKLQDGSFYQRSCSCIYIRIQNEKLSETTYDFIAPPRWDTGLADLAAAEARLAALEAQIDDEVYRLYGISDADRAAIEAELAGKSLANDDEDMESALSNADEDATDTTPSMTPEELAVRWISYAIGIVLGRFTVGLVADPKIQNQKSTIGNAIYCREDFAIGSLPAPDAAEFDALVGPPERFAYVDEAGGRHVFPAEVEAALRALALPDGIAVLDAGHPRDLPALVEKALALMLDSSDMQYATCNGDNSIVHRAYQGTHTAEVIRLGAGGDLRAFLSKDFFTQWHLKWYRKRPVYWPLQSAKRNYGFVLFHEKVEQYTLYILMRDYLDYKRNGVQLALGDLAEQREAQSGAARRRTERRIAEVTALQEELAEFARTLDRLARAGYEPAPDWIDDGVLLRLAPLWEVIPLWKSEPRKAWEALEAGKYDWSHIAMRYWPERVKAACRENKSYAIAHNIFDF
ncbi:MAG TPA: hypothetical protein PLM06_09105 [Anaerolineae bacterium]|nr:hypothetical protein [Anaerolineae bacterium]